MALKNSRFLLTHTHFNYFLESSIDELSKHIKKIYFTSILYILIFIKIVSNIIFKKQIISFFDKYIFKYYFRLLLNTTKRICAPLAGKWQITSS